MLLSLIIFCIICRKKFNVSETNTSSLSQDISIENSLAHALGSQEHCGRALGPCPSRVFEYTRNFHFGTSSSCPSYSELKNQVIQHSISYVAI